MESTVAKVRMFIQQHNMLDGARGALVAVSGGPDSVTVLDILLRILSSGRAAQDASPEESSVPSRVCLGAANGGGLRSSHSPPSLMLQSGAGGSLTLRLYVGHLNHGLRADSADDAAFVAQAAERNGLASIVGSADVRSEAAASCRGIEEAAREARYRFLLESARKLGVDRIITGHTMDDQAETVIMRLARGTGSKGLAGMKPVVAAHEFGDLRLASGSIAPDARGATTGDSGIEASQKSIVPVSIIRPLLCLTRNEVELYCLERGLEFRTDSSNNDHDIARNKIRHAVMPILKSMNPRAVEAIARTAEIIGTEDEAMDAAAEHALQRAGVAPSNNGLRSDGSASYSIGEFIAQPGAIRRRMLIRTIQTAQRAVQLTSAHIAALESLITTPESGRRITLPGGLDVWRVYESLRIVGRNMGDRIDELRLDAERLVIVQGISLSLQRGVSSAEYRPLIEAAKQHRSLTGQDWMTALLDDEKVPKRLIVRPRIAGETAVVIGHEHPKKLKKLMIDYRIPVSLRSKWPLVAGMEGCYIWSPCLPPSSDFSATKESKALAVVRARRAGQ